jgi:hypothetical protein
MSQTFQKLTVCTLGEDWDKRLVSESHSEYPLPCTLYTWCVPRVVWYLAVVSEICCSNSVRCIVLMFGEYTGTRIPGLQVETSSLHPTVKKIQLIQQTVINPTHPGRKKKQRRQK